MSLRLSPAALALHYRLAPEHPYPAELQDALAVWTELTEPRDGPAVAPERIAVAGDSAGGGLALALAPLSPRRRAPAAGGDRPVVAEHLPDLWHDAHVSAALLAEPGGRSAVAHGRRAARPRAGPLTPSRAGC